MLTHSLTLGRYLNCSTELQLLANKWQTIAQMVQQKPSILERLKGQPVAKMQLKEPCISCSSDCCDGIYLTRSHLREEELVVRESVRLWWERPGGGWQEQRAWRQEREAAVTLCPQEADNTTVSTLRKQPTPIFYSLSLFSSVQGPSAWNGVTRRWVSLPTSINPILTVSTAMPRDFSSRRF